MAGTISLEEIQTELKQVGTVGKAVTVVKKQMAALNDAANGKGGLASELAADLAAVLDSPELAKIEARAKVLRKSEKMFRELTGELEEADTAKK